MESCWPFTEFLVGGLARVETGTFSSYWEFQLGLGF